MGGISEEAIRERAYHIWLREGCPHGRDHEHWVKAQVELEAEARGNGAAPPLKKAAAPRKTPAAKAPAAKKPAAAKAKAAPRKPAAKRS